LTQAGEPAAAAGLSERSDHFKARFEQAFWRADEPSYALGLDRSKRPLNVATSNMGHVLWGGLASPEQARTVARRLLEPDLFTGWGVRTLSSQEARYEPLGYHVGSVWPHDTAIAVAGFRRYGLDVPAERLTRGLLDAADRFPQRRLPEAFAGSARRSGSSPRPYPSANRPQAWAAGAVFHLLHSTLGVVADAPNGRLSIVSPRLPPGVDRLDLQDLRVGQASVDLHFERAGMVVRAEVAHATGTLDVDLVDEWPADGPGLP
jgi:glycogen debranching enzyme